MHPQDLSLRAQAGAVSADEIDPFDLLEKTLSRIEERNDRLRAVVEIFSSESARMLREAPDGLIRGVPVLIKDDWSLPWRSPRCGATRTLWNTGANGSAVYHRLRKAGAVIAGVTNMHELGLGTTGLISAYGACHNPWSLDHCPGGSSSGSAAAVAARMTSGAIGSDGGGSVRIPAAWCGVVGLKLTWGTVPLDGHAVAHSSMISAGILCRDSGDARLLGQALLSRPLIGALDDLRIGIPRRVLWENIHPEVESACFEALEALEATGATTIEVDIPGSEHAGTATTYGLGLETAAELTPDSVNDLTDAISPVARSLIKLSLLTPAAVAGRVERVRTWLRRSLVDLFSEVDVLAWPTVPAVAPPMDNPTLDLPGGSEPADAANVRLTGLANLTGIPSISVPCGFSDAGLPIGLMLHAPWGEETTLIDAAELIELATERQFVESTLPLSRPATG